MLKRKWSITKQRAMRGIACLVLFAFTVTEIFPSSSFAQNLLTLPVPGTMVNLSPVFAPPLLKGLKIHPDNPFKFGFIVDMGKSKIEGEEVKKESERLIKYFLASLTVPEKEIWVNLSPYEKDRIIPEKLGTTAMGRDLLAQDYILKQLTASLIYPENDLGKAFWDKVYQKAYELFGTTNIPINTFNKVWIVPSKVVVFENNDTVFIKEARLKVMLEEDYLALNNNLNDKEIGTDELAENDVKQLNNVSSKIVREIILPAIEKEVNEGENFANLRQIYHSLVLAAWFKGTLKESLLNKVYADKGKVTGVESDDEKSKDKIYDQYIEAFKKGVYDYIKEDYNQNVQQTFTRRYFSGGFVAELNGGPIYDGMGKIWLSDAAAVENSLGDRGLYIDAALPPIKRRKGGDNDLILDEEFNDENFGSSPDFTDQPNINKQTNKQTKTSPIIPTDQNEDSITNDVQKLEDSTGGLMGRWEYERATFDKKSGQLTLHNATRMPRKDGVIEEEFLIDGRNLERDIVLQTRELNVDEQAMVEKYKSEFGIINEVRGIVRDVSAIRYRIYGAAADGISFIREDIFVEGSTNQIKEALDHEVRELSPKSHDEIRREQYRGNLRALITRLSDMDKEEATRFKKILDTLENETPLIEESSQYGIRLYFFKARIHMYIHQGPDVFVSRMNVEAYYTENLRAIVGDEIKIGKDEIEILKKKTLDCLSRFRRSDRGIDEYLKVIERNQVQKERMIQLKEKYAREPVADEGARAKLLSELNNLFDIEFDNLKPEQIERIQILLASLGEEPLYPGEKFAFKEVPDFPMDRNIYKIQQGDIVYIQYETASKDWRSETIKEYSGVIQKVPSRTGKPVLIMAGGKEININYVIEIIAEEGHYKGSGGGEAAEFFTGGFLYKNRIVEGEIPEVNDSEIKDQLKDMKDTVYWPGIDLSKSVKIIVKSESIKETAWRKMTGEKVVVIEAPTEQNNGVFMLKKADGRYGDHDMVDIKRIYRIGVDQEVAQQKTHRFKKGDRVVVFEKGETFHGVVEDFYVKPFVGRRMVVKLEDSPDPSKPYVHIKFVNELESTLVEVKNNISKKLIRNAFEKMHEIINTKLMIRNDVKDETMDFWEQFKTVYETLFGPEGVFEREDFNIKKLDDIFQQTMGITIGQLFEGILKGETSAKFTPLSQIAHTLDQLERAEIEKIHQKIQFSIRFFAGKTVASTGTIPMVVKEENFVNVLSGQPPESDFIMSALLKYFSNESFSFADRIGLDFKIVWARERSNLDDVLRKIAESREKLENLSPNAREVAAEEYSKDLSDPDDIQVVKFVLGVEDEAKLTNINPRDDITISSSATDEEHMAYNERVTQRGKVMDDLARELGADRIARLANGDYDFLTAISGLKNFDRPTNRLLLPLVKKFGRPYVEKDAAGNIIVTLKGTGRYMIVTNSKDTITKQPELIFIDPSFGADHARNQIYARTFAKAIHKLTELRLWKALERGLILGLDGLNKEINPDPAFPGPHNIREWIKANISRAELLDAYFHQLGLSKEYDFTSSLIYDKKNIDRQLYMFYEELCGDLKNVVKLNFKELISLEEELTKYPPNPVSFGEMMTIFRESPPEAILKLSSRPTPEQFERLSNELPFEVGIIQRKSTGEWFAIRGYEEEMLKSNGIPIGVIPPRVQSWFEFILNVRNDIAYDYHTHPRSMSTMAIPPSAGDFIYLLYKNGTRVASVGCGQYIYAYSVRDPALRVLREELPGRLERKLQRGYEKIYQKLAAEGVVSLKDGDYFPVTNDANDRFFQEWKSFVESLGFGLERHTWTEFKEKSEEIFAKLRDDTPLPAKAEDIVISSEAKSDLSTVGSNKPLGYVPMSELSELEIKQVTRYVAENQLEMRKLKNSEGEEELYVFDRDSLNKLLIEKMFILERVSIPIGVDAFIEYISKHFVFDREAYQVVSSAFGRFSDSVKLDLVGSLADLAGKLSSPQVSGLNLKQVLINLYVNLGKTIATSPDDEIVRRAESVLSTVFKGIGVLQDGIEVILNGSPVDPKLEVPLVKIDAIQLKDIRKFDDYRVAGIDSSRAKSDPASLTAIQKGQPVLAAELPTDEFNSQWNQYVQNEHLSNYPELLKLFTPEIKQALLDDPALRPVFLEVLPAEAQGEMIIPEYNKDVVAQKIGDKTLGEYMKEYSVFKVGTAEVANELAQNSPSRIVVGVVDRRSWFTLYSPHVVANGRQVYFPLPDGTWLGVKGAGQTYNDVDPPHYWHDPAVYLDRREQGVAKQEEAELAVKAMADLKDSKGYFVTLLGFRPVYALPDGKGNVISTEKLKDRETDEKIHPVLIFNRVLSPHRIVKLPQLLAKDEAWERQIRKISNALIGLGYLASGERLSGRDLFLMIMEKRGITEAVKQNKGWMKSTLHWQDITITGEEADNEEFRSLDDQKTRITEIRNMGIAHGFPRMLFEHDLVDGGILDTVCIIMEMVELNKGQNLLLPDPHQALERLFKSYFENLDQRYLEIWATEIQKNGSPRPLPTESWNLRDLYPHYYLGVTMGGEKFWETWDTKIYSKIITLARDEIQNRQIAQTDGGDVGKIDQRSPADKASLTAIQKGQPVLAAELPTDEFNSQWDQYVQNERLSNYHELLKLFTPEIKQALLDDPALRPVFLEVLPAEAQGEMIIPEYNRDVVAQKIGDKTLGEYMQEYSVFKVGTVEVANELAENSSSRIVIGVVDRSSFKSFNPDYKVANGRQVYFPLPDGTWLGVKGAGQFSDENKPSHYWNRHPTNLLMDREEGVVTEEEAILAVNAMAKLRNTGGTFVQTLGWKSLLALPYAGEKYSIAMEHGHFGRLHGGAPSMSRWVRGPLRHPITKEKISPVLIFNRVLSPHRLSKLPQLVETGVGWERQVRKLLNTFHRLGILPEDKELSDGELLLWVMKRVGVTEAIKQNKGWFKETLHSQDITITGEEADIEEFHPSEEYKSFLQEALNRSGMGQYMNEELLREHKFKGMANAVEILTEIAWMAEGQKILLPNPYHAFELLFKTYFANLSEENLQLWTTETAKNNGQTRPLPAQSWEMRIDLLHPNLEELQNGYRLILYGSGTKDREDYMYSTIFNLVRDEIQKRHSGDFSGSGGAASPDAASLSGKKDDGPVSRTADYDFDKGGIDFDPAKIEMDIQGKGIDFQLPVPTGSSGPVDLKQWQQLQFDGLDLRILNIIPIVPANLPVILGLEKAPASVPQKRASL